ncbi:MAG: hypothetical protein DDT25_00295 [Chloroflexi bacterium]|nr:hypothetical protein [Chloroflexota bacterium]
MYASLNDLTLMVGFTEEQQDQLRRALGEDQVLFERSFPITVREAVWLAKVVWPQLSKVVDEDVELAISEHGLDTTAATNWGMETHKAMSVLIHRMQRIAVRNTSELTIGLAGTQDAGHAAIGIQGVDFLDGKNVVHMADYRASRS